MEGRLHPPPSALPPTAPLLPSLSPLPLPSLPPPSPLPPPPLPSPPLAPLPSTPLPPLPPLRSLARSPSPSPSRTTPSLTPSLTLSSAALAPALLHSAPINSLFQSLNTFLFYRAVLVSRPCPHFYTVYLYLSPHAPLLLSSSRQSSCFSWFRLVSSRSRHVGRRRSASVNKRQATTHHPPTYLLALRPSRRRVDLAYLIIFTHSDTASQLTGHGRKKNGKKK